VELESYSANEITKVIRAAYNVRIFCGCSAAYGDSPTMSVLTRRVHLAFFRSQHFGGVSIYDRSVDRKALKETAESENWTLLRVGGRNQTLTRIRSVDIAFNGVVGPRHDIEAASGVAVTSENGDDVGHPLHLPKKTTHPPIVTMLDALVYSSSPSFALRLCYELIHTHREKFRSRKAEVVSGLFNFLESFRTMCSPGLFTFAAFPQAHLLPPSPLWPIYGYLDFFFHKVA
jgi:hypothetical protein